MNLRRWSPALAWAGVILLLTSVPGQAVPNVGIPYLDKVVHLAMYGVLGALLARAAADAPSPARLSLLLFGAVAMFAAADEWHQRFIPDRSQDRYDWLADMVGAGAALTFEGAARLRRTSLS